MPNYLTCLSEKVTQYRDYFPQRKTELFLEFLPLGYERTTLSSVTARSKEKIIYIKTILGMLITLYDDFADNPNLINPRLLKELYKIPFEQLPINRCLSTHENQIFEFAATLIETLFAELSEFKNFNALRCLFEFDLQQFFHCNRYFELIQKFPHMINLYELSFFSGFNMGIVLAGMIDIVASDKFHYHEFGTVRLFLHHAQRYGKICNNLSTLSRELTENDLSNEILIRGLQQKNILPQELKLISIAQLKNKLASVIRQYETECQDILARLAQIEIISFDKEIYLAGLKYLKQLHHDYEGII